MGPAANDVFRAIADPTRRRILTGLAKGPRSAGQICDQFELSQPTISVHLEILRGAGLVRVRAEGRSRVYSLEAGPLREVDAWIGQLEKFWSRRLVKPGRALDARAARKGSKRGA